MVFRGELKVGDRVKVRQWYAEGPADGNYYTWTGPWLDGVVKSFNKYQHPWVTFTNERGNSDSKYFGLEDVVL